MVNVDFSPALILGLGMVAGGVLLYNVRINRPYISRDYDVVISSISVLVGGILIFQVGLPWAAFGIRQSDAALASTWVSHPFQLPGLETGPAAALRAAPDSWHGDCICT